MKARIVELPHVDPIIPRKKKLPFVDQEWLFELKYDGFHGLLYHKHERSRLISKTDKRLPFQKLEESLSKCLSKHDLILDGEVVSLDPSGRPIFSNLVRRTGNIVYIAFDILWLDGKDLRDMPLTDRKKILSRFAEFRAKECLRGAFGTIGKGMALFEVIRKQDLEGIVAKRLSSPYARRTEWLKVLNPDYSQSKNRPRWNY